MRIKTIYVNCFMQNNVALGLIEKKNILEKK